MFNISNISFQEEVLLKKLNWLPDSRFRLEKLIAENAYQNKIVVLDFDNTILCGDIGESVFQLMTAENVIIKNETINALSPSFNNGERTISLDSLNFDEYYNQLLTVTEHKFDETSHSIAYSWVVQIMSKIELAELISFTDKVLNEKVKDENQPLFYPEMIDLIGVLLQNGYKVNIVSASNVWSVRWVVVNYLNPLLMKQCGKNAIISPSSVFGMNTLLFNRSDKKLYKDEQLLLDKEYLNFDFSELSKYTLTSLINFPATSYYGKAALILKKIGYDKIFLVAGDSPNDFAMQRLAENVLWIARSNKPEYQKLAASEIEEEINNWIVQPTVSEEYIGFVSSFDKFSGK